MTLELVAEQPNWMRSLQVAMTRPTGAPERRTEQDPWEPPPMSRPRRISDDLSWLRAAMDEPQVYGLHQIDDSAAVGAWEASDDDLELRERFQRLDDRGVLDAAGFIFR